MRRVSPAKGSNILTRPYVPYRYPYIATEVLCSDIWSIVETCLSRSDQLLNPFWETVLDQPPEAFKEPSQMALASFFAKVNAVFLSKKSAEVNCISCALPRTRI